MQFVKQSWQFIISQLGHLSVNAKLLLGSLLIILVLALLLIIRYAGSTDYVPISQFASDRPGEVITRLETSGIRVKQENGQIKVPASQQIDAIAVLHRSNLAAADTSAAYEQLLKSNIWTSNNQFNKRAHWALQQSLGQIIGKWPDVRSAHVVIAIPQHKGFATRYAKPSASVNLFMYAGKRVDRHTVEAIAAMVAGAISELQPQKVTIVDANIGRQYTGKSEDDYGQEEAMAVVVARERKYRDKIVDLLRFIPNVIVAVNVNTHEIASKDVKMYTYAEDVPTRSTETINESRQNTATNGEPGISSNAGATIASLPPAGSKETRDTSREEFGPREIVEQSSVRHLGQSTTQVSASVNVPRSYFISLRQDDEQEKVELDDAFVQAELKSIEDKVRPLLLLEGKQPVLQVSDYDDRPMQIALATQLPAPTGMSAVIHSDWLRPVGLTLLCLMALAMMFSMVRKATQNLPMPSAEELAGLPPVLTGDEELIGQVEESDPSMAGIEVDEAELRSRKIADQISEMIKSSPEEAGLLISKWVKTRT